MNCYWNRNGRVIPINESLKTGNYFVIFKICNNNIVIFNYYFLKAMNFYFIYLIIPIVLYLFRREKPNTLLVAYFFFVTIFSYDNSTDFAYWYQNFLDARNGFQIQTRNGFELGWVFLLRIFSFSKYGILFVHSISVFLFLHLLS